MRVVNLANLEQFAAVNLTSDPGYDPSDRTIPNCAEVRLNWTMPDGNIAHNVMHARTQAGFVPTSAIAESLFAAFKSLFTSSGLTAHIAPQTFVSGVSLRDVSLPDQPYYESTTGPTPGTSTGTALPSEVAVVLTLRTAKAGPRFRGRIYLGGFASTALGAGDVIAAAALTACNNFGSGIDGVMSGQSLDFALGLHKRKAYIGISGKPHPDKPATTELVTSAVTRDNHWDTQRRRGLS